jgi:hypothetical protein
VCPPERPRRSTFHVPFHYSSKVNIIEHKRTHLVNRITRGALACFEKAFTQIWKTHGIGMVGFGGGESEAEAGVRGMGAGSSVGFDVYGMTTPHQPSEAY